MAKNAKKQHEKQKEYDELVEKIMDAENMQNYLGHFSRKDIINVFFGATIVGLSFMFTARFIDIAIHLNWSNVLLILGFNLAVLAAEIYFIGYSRVLDKKERPIREFMSKRLVAFYGISFLVSAFLIVAFGLETIAGTNENTIKLLFVLTLPSSIAAAITDMVKKYV